MDITIHKYPSFPKSLIGNLFVKYMDFCLEHAGMSAYFTQQAFCPLSLEKVVERGIIVQDLIMWFAHPERIKALYEHGFYKELEVSHESL